MMFQSGCAFKSIGKFIPTNKKTFCSPQSGEILSARWCEERIAHHLERKARMNNSMSKRSIGLGGGREMRDEEDEEVKIN